MRGRVEDGSVNRSLFYRCKKLKNGNMGQSNLRLGNPFSPFLHLVNRSPDPRGKPSHFRNYGNTKLKGRKTQVSFILFSIFHLLLIDQHINRNCFYPREEKKSNIMVISTITIPSLEHPPDMMVCKSECHSESSTVFKGYLFPKSVKKKGTINANKDIRNHLDMKTNTYQVSRKSDVVLTDNLRREFNSENCHFNYRYCMKTELGDMKMYTTKFSKSHKEVCNYEGIRIPFTVTISLQNHHCRKLGNPSRPQEDRSDTETMSAYVPDWLLGIDEDFDINDIPDNDDIVSGKSDEDDPPRSASRSKNKGEERPTRNSSKKPRKKSKCVSPAPADKEVEVNHWKPHIKSAISTFNKQTSLRGNQGLYFDIEEGVLRHRPCYRVDTIQAEERMNNGILGDQMMKLHHDWDEMKKNDRPKTDQIRVPELDGYLLHVMNSNPSGQGIVLVVNDGEILPLLEFLESPRKFSQKELSEMGFDLTNDVGITTRNSRSRQGYLIDREFLENNEMGLLMLARGSGTLVTASMNDGEYYAVVSGDIVHCQLEKGNLGQDTHSREREAYLGRRRRWEDNMWVEAEKIHVNRQAAILAYEREHGKPEAIADKEEDPESEEETISVHQPSITSRTSVKSSSSTSLSTLTGFSALSAGTPLEGFLNPEIFVPQVPRRSPRVAVKAIGRGDFEQWENQADGPSYSIGTIRYQALGRTGWVVTNGIVVPPGVKRARNDRSNEGKTYEIYRRNKQPVYMDLRPSEVTKEQIQKQLMGDDNYRIGIERNDGSMLYFSRPPGDSFFMPWFSNEDTTWRDFRLNRPTSSSSSSTSQDTNWYITTGESKSYTVGASNQREVSSNTSMSSSSSSSSGKG